MSDIYIEYLPQIGNPQFDMAAKRIIDLLRTYLSEHDTSLTALEASITWVEIVSFSNSWVNYGSGFETAAYCKDPKGFVHLKGRIKNGTLGAAAFTLPAGYRPFNSLEMVFPSTQYSGTAYVAALTGVQSDGDVIPYGAYNAEHCLDGITFYAA